MSPGIANHSIKVFSLYDGIPLYNSKSMRSLRSILAFSYSKAAELRLKVIEFHKTYGTKATVDAYGVSKATIYRWKKKLNDSGGMLESLIPLSKTPKRKRMMKICPKIINFIKFLRENKPHLGKEKNKASFG